MDSPVPSIPPQRTDAPPAEAEPGLAGKPSLRVLFEVEESPLLRFAFGLAGRREVAEDLVQEAFLRLHRQWEQVENPRAWLYRCVRNLALNHLRDHKREVIGEPLAEPAGDGRPDEDLGRLEAVGMVRMLMAEMPPDDRALIVLKYHEDMKYAAISQHTGQSVGNVGYRLHHLLKGMGDALRRAGVEGSKG